MQIRYLKLLNFRNYDSLEINFSDNLNLIYGKNGMGKTNLVEAIYVLALTKSFRTTNDKVLIAKDKDLFKVEGIINDKSENNYKIILNNEGKKAKINNTKIAKLSDYISKFSVILFNPEDLRMIKDSPSVRRKTLNMELSQLNNQYLKYLNNYNKVLKQRNAYLKTLYINKTASVDYLDILTTELINYGEKIFYMRKDFFEKVNELISGIYEKITNKKGLVVKYYSDFEDFNKDKIFKKYKETQEKDIVLGKTGYGIHKDDFTFYLNSDNLKDFGSEGQQKNVVIAYKIAELEIFFEKNLSYPILILDDLFSELDQEKIQNIFGMLDNNIQTFITTTEIDKVNKEIIKKSRRYKIENGTIEEVKT